MSKILRAQVMFLPTAEGGFLRPPANGIRPQLKLGDVLTSCIIQNEGKESIFELGKEYAVRIEILFWDEYKQFFQDRMLVELHDGSRIIGRGQFL